MQNNTPPSLTVFCISINTTTKQLDEIAKFRKNMQPLRCVLSKLINTHASTIEAIWCSANVGKSILVLTAY